MAPFGSSDGDNPDIGALQALGLDAAEQMVYGALFDGEALSARQIAEALQQPERAVQKSLSSLEMKGFVTRLPERPPRYLPAPPDIAIEATIMKRQGELQQARLVGEQLREKLIRGRPMQKQEDRVVEIISGSEAQLRIYEQLQSSARHEFLGVERPPYVMGVTSRNVAQERALARGVAYRNIVDASTLELPGALERLRRQTQAGEDTRVFAGVSLKLAVIDRSVALVPLSLDRVYDAGLLVRSSTLLDALCQLFDLMWQSAVPIPLLDPLPGPEAAQSSPDADRLVALLASGLNDKVIADDLGMSARTLDRRIVDLMKGLNARTRFQAGWLAAQRMSEK